MAVCLHSLPPIRQAEQLPSGRPRFYLPFFVSMFRTEAGCCAELANQGLSVGDRHLFWLSDEAWATIEAHLPKNQPSARRVDDRRVISGILRAPKSVCGGGTALGLWSPHNGLQSLQSLVSPAHLAMHSASFIEAAWIEATASRRVHASNGSPDPFGGRCARSLPRCK